MSFRGIWRKYIKGTAKRLCLENVKQWQDFSRIWPWCCKTDPRYVCHREFSLKQLPYDPLFQLFDTVLTRINPGDILSDLTAGGCLNSQKCALASWNFGRSGV